MTWVHWIEQYELRGSLDSQQQYLANLIHTYFPHLRKEYSGKQFALPDVQDLKDVRSCANPALFAAAWLCNILSVCLSRLFWQLLFENKVGYMKHSHKLHVRRFYRLPAILFPEETMTQTLLLDR